MILLGSRDDRKRLIDPVSRDQNSQMNTRRSMVTRIPPATALLMAAMSLVSLLASKFRLFSSSSRESFIWRACLSTLYHNDRFHLILNLSWGFFTFKRLEELLGSTNFLLTTVSLTFLLKIVIFILSLLFPIFSTTNDPWNQIFRQGFSGVLFSLHSLLIVPSPQYQQAINNLHRGWENNNLFLVAALVLIAVLQACTLPNVFFFDNLGGIVVGILYIKAFPYLKSYVRYTWIHCNVLLSRLMSTNHHSQSSATHNVVPFTSHYEYDARYEAQQEAEENEIDDHLEWKCDGCNRRNGVYHDICDSCAHPRSHQNNSYSTSTC